MVYSPRSAAAGELAGGGQEGSVSLGFVVNQQDCDSRRESTNSVKEQLRGGVTQFLAWERLGKGVRTSSPRLCGANQSTIGKESGRESFTEKILSRQAKDGVFRWQQAEQSVDVSSLNRKSAGKIHDTPCPSGLSDPEGQASASKDVVTVRVF